MSLPGAAEGGGAMPWEIDMSRVTCTRLIASGAFGSVYHGAWEGRDVAVKVMNVPENVTRKHLEGLQSSFKQEVIVWHELVHPNIVQFYGASMEGSRLTCPAEDFPGKSSNVELWAIVTEFCSGGTLKSYLMKTRHIPLRRVLGFALDIARGMEYLHSQKLVHRDLKSDNILLSGEQKLKIADFGVARLEAHNPADMTCETGTVRWMAPEIIDGKPYDRKVDIYSFGIVLWEIYTCEHPFQMLSFVQLAYAIVNKGMRPEVPKSCPSELADLMKRCWDASAERRPEFAELVQSLEAMLGPDGIVSKLDPPLCRCTLI